MPTTAFMQLTLAGLLAVQWWFLRRDRARQQRTANQWTGHGIDVTEISGRLEKVRVGFVQEAQGRRQTGWRQSILLALARRMIGRLAYFQRWHS